MKNKLIIFNVKKNYFIKNLVFNTKKRKIKINFNNE